MAPFDDTPLGSSYPNQPDVPPPDPVQPDVEPDDGDTEEELSDYWAHLDGDELGAEVIKRFTSFREWLSSNGLLRAWLLKMSYYHNEYRSNPAFPHLNILQQFGAQGEYQFCSINHLRSLLKTVLGSVVQNPPNFATRATNTDADAEEAAALFDGVLQYYIRTMRIRQKIAKAAEIGIVVDQSFARIEWDFFSSSPQKQDGIWQGDISVGVHYPWEVCYDMMKSAWSDQDWVIVRDWVPRQKVLAQFPEFKHDIKAAATRGQVTMGSLSESEVNTRWYIYGIGDDISEDIQIFKLFYRASPWMPNGRFCMILENGKMLYDSPSGLIYPRIPVERFSCDDNIDILMGYSPINELIAPQEALNTIVSSIVTNAINFGNQFIAAQQGTELNPKTLETGQRILEFPAGSPAPQGLNLTAIPPTMFQAVQELQAFMQIVPGVSNVSRGEVPGANSTGSAMLFSASQTTQNQGAMTENFADFTSNVYTQLLHTLRVFGRTERTVEISGATVASQTIIMAEALKDFDEVTVDQGNPVLNTPQGRLGMAQSMMQFGNATAKEALMVATSGNLNAATDAVRESEFYLGKENQWLIEGKKVVVDALDDHEAHIMKHSQLKNTPWLRMPDLAQQLGKTKAPQILQTINDHISQHMQMLAQNHANTAQPPGSPLKPSSAALGNLAPKDTAQVGPDNPTQGAAKSIGSALPNQPNSPK